MNLESDVVVGRKLFVATFLGVFWNDLIMISFVATSGDTVENFLNLRAALFAVHLLDLLQCSSHASQCSAILLHCYIAALL